MLFAARDVHGEGVSVVELSGEIDVDSAPRMRAALDAALKTGVPIVIDMDGVTLMDSTGIAVLVSVNLRAMRIGTPVVLPAIPARIRRWPGP
jgi:anti-sigma B factor antagonist